jgi:cobalt-precorrin 5A hydrolase
MRITLVSFTKNGACICKRLTDFLRKMGHTAIGYAKYGGDALLPLEESIRNFTGKSFGNSHAIVFVGAAGIAVRAIAPFLKSKARDPAVIVINETGEYVIPILSGHLGGANRLSEIMAGFLGGKAVITTATDINGVFPVDVWAKENALYIENIGSIKHVSAALLNKEKIGFRCDFPVDGELPGFFTYETANSGICIINLDSIFMDKPPFRNTLFLRPKQYVAGIGCRKGIAAEHLEEVFLEALQKKNIPWNLVCSIATIDIKKEEEAIIKLCEKYGYEFEAYTKDELLQAKGNFSSSEFVRSITGVDNVCERAALLASNHGVSVLEKTSNSGVTVSIAVKIWRCSF